jgi:hypothetical protein
VGRRLLGLPVQPHKLRTRLDAVIGAVTRTPVQLADPLISLRARLQERLQDLHETSDGVDGLGIALEEVDRALERARHPQLTTDVPPQVAT